MIVTYLLLLCGYGYGVHSFTIPSHLEEEKHAIIKRFADHNFEGHDIAYVLHEKHPNAFHKLHRRDLSSVTNENYGKRVRLNLNSGGNLNLVLKKRAIVDEDTEYYQHTENGMVKRDASQTGCFAAGHEESSPDEIAAVSLCNGLYGMVNSNGFEYYIHPVEQDGDEHQVHILWRRSTEGDGVSDLIEVPGGLRSGNLQFDAWETENDLTIEMAVFSDAQYWEFLHERVPGREDDYLLVSIAAVQALYGDPEKIGYNFRIKVKSLVHWIANPDGYNFTEDLSSNLGQFCRLVRDDYPHDMLFLHTGVRDQGGPAVGMAYMSGVCGKSRCGNTLLLSLNRQSTIAHEIGHNLGFSHHDAAKCPAEIKSLGGGFMGAGSRLTVSPCNKWELQHLFESGKGACLFEETVKVKKGKFPKKYIDQPMVMQGQSRSPDGICQLYVGDEYTYFRPYQLEGIAECQLLMCANFKKNSPEFGKIVKLETPIGFPCGEEMFCNRADACLPWTDDKIGWDVEYLRSLKQENEWSSWPKKWSKCSRNCGTGVQIKERKCKIKNGPNVTPYCNGVSMEARLCNKKPCNDDPESVEELIQHRGDEQCEKYYNDHVIFNKETERNYQPNSTVFVIRTVESAHIASKSCILTCTRDDGNSNGKMDAIMPDGTPCLERTRSEYNLDRFQIEMRCAKGLCMEFSKCKRNELKDACGICGGDPDRCMTTTIDEDIPEGDRAVLEIIPAGSTGIDVEAVKKGGKLELWSNEGVPVFGPGGDFPKGKYIDEKMVEFAGTMWSLDNSRFIRADGPTDVDLVVKVLREDKPVGLININYLLA